MEPSETGLQKRLLEWSTESHLIAEKIRERRGRAKIVLKVRNDPKSTRDWFDHHARIVGAENLIVADNDSTDPLQALELERIAEQALVFSFRGFHNTIHSRVHFSRLHHAISESCDYTIFMDADERLFLTSLDEHLSDSRIVDYLVERDAGGSPALLVNNAHGLSDTLHIPSGNSGLQGLRSWGKPFIKASEAELPDSPNVPVHNCQFPPQLFPPGTKHELVILHLTSLDPEQRIRANLEKLRARGIKTDGLREELDRFDELSRHPDPVIVRCAFEITNILKGGSSYGSNRQKDREITFGADGKLVFGSEVVHLDFDRVRSDIELE